MSSRVARIPVVIPAGVDATIAEGLLSVKGPLGALSQAMSANVKVSKVDNRLEFEAVGESIQARAMSGTLRALAANMVQGVSKGFERRLNLVGVGYRAQAQGDKLNLTLGFSHPVVHAMPKGVKVETPTQTEIVIKGIDKQQVGEVAAQVRAYRPPEPYKGKGVRYSNEQIVLKETKKK
jgi:large subunit ribosomal protein L6